MSKLGLVDYSDSESSDTDPVSATKTKSSSKPTFEKVVDRSNPHKIRVHLPTASKESSGDGATTGEEPPSKRARTGGGAFSGFNSLLPAPKRKPQGTAGGGLGEPGSKGSAVGSKVQLKTGATPAFSRDVEPPSGVLEEPRAVSDGEGNSIEQAREKTVVQHGVPPIAVDSSFPGEVTNPDVKKEAKPMMFKPLSVARKSQKKKPMTPATSEATPSHTAVAELKPKDTPKRTLFSLGNHESPALTTSATEEYKPMLYESHQDDTSASFGPPFNPEKLQEPEPFQQVTQEISSVAPGPQSLDSIAADLGLSESAKRQLFGRQKGVRQDAAARRPPASIITFNTDQEYAANEALRAAGEAVTHNPVRAIAPGKHNLKQLVNAANTQREALEEHFAAGRRNKKEAGSKYGW